MARMTPRLLLLAVLLLCGPLVHAEVKVRVLRVPLAAVAPNGTQDITLAGFGTPKGALLFLGSAVADGTPASHANFAVGATDCTNQWTSHFQDEDALVTSETNRRATTAFALQFFDLTTVVVDFEATATCIPDGLRLTIPTPASAAFLLHVVLFGGSDVTTKAGTVTSAASIDGTVDVTTVGFLPQDIFFAANPMTTWTNTTLASATLSLGMMTCGGGQGSAGVFSTDGNTTMAQTSGLHSAWIATVGSSDFPQRAILVSDCDSQGFTVITKELATATAYGYLAVTYNGTARSWVGQLTTSATPQSVSYTGPGWRPQAALLLTTSIFPGQVTSDGTELFDLGDGAGSWGVGLLDTQNQYTLSTFFHDGAGNANTGTMSDDLPLHMLNATSDPAIIAFAVGTFGGFTSQGLTLNYTVLPGTLAFWGWMLEAVAPRRHGGVVWLE